MADELDVRASDADRERVVSALRVAFAEGRLSVVELEERLTEAYGARTLRDLAGPLRDLPPVPAVPAPAVPVPVAELGDRLSERRRPPRPGRPRTR